MAPLASPRNPVETSVAAKVGESSKTLSLGRGIGVVVVLAACMGAYWGWREMTKSALHKNSENSENDDQPQVSLSSSPPWRISLPAEVVKTMGIESTPATLASLPRTMQLFGTLQVDSQSLVRVRTRFPGEVVELAMVEDDAEIRPDAEPGRRALRFGDKIKKGDLLAVIWSKDLGEEKSKLVDAYSEYHLNTRQLTRLQGLAKDGIAPEKNVLEAQRKVDASLIEISTIERTLRSWRMTEEEIDSVKAEADHYHLTQTAPDVERERNWARLEIRAPEDGTIVEQNAVVGDLVDNVTDLFKIADLSTLTVWAHAYEEDVLLLRALPEDRRRWRIRLKADPEAPVQERPIEHISDVLDPSQHTALVMSRVDNRDGKLQAGQFITATIDLPARPDEVEIPTSAILEDGRESVVMVQPEPNSSEYERRRVAVVERRHDKVFVRSRVTQEQESQGLRPLAPAEYVVVDGALQLNVAIGNLIAALPRQPANPPPRRTESN